MCSVGRAAPLRRLLAEASEFGERGGAGELRWATAPYAARGAAPAPAPAADPRHHTVLLFPGAGAARVGMGLALRDLQPARDLYRLASDVLGWDVWRTCTAGPARELAARAEPAVLVTALAALQRVRAERPAALERARAAAGAGAGELAALVFAGALSPDAALRLAAARAAAADGAGGARRGGTLAVRLEPAPTARLRALLAAARDHAAARGVPHPVCQVAAYLGPGRKLIAGDVEALEWVERHGRAAGVARAARLAAPALHTPLAAAAGEAASAAAEALAAAGAVRAPRLRVVSCSSGRALRSAEEAAGALWRGVTAPLRWEQALQALYARPAGTPQPLTLALADPALRRQLRRVNARAYDASIDVPV